MVEKLDIQIETKVKKKAKLEAKCIDEMIVEHPEENTHQHILGVKVRFPYTPYPSQLELMKKIIESIDKGQSAILESPTGTGKTLSILCSSLSWLEHAKQRRRIYFEQLAENMGARIEGNVPMNHIETQPINDSTIDLDKRPKFDDSFHVPKIFITSRTQSQIQQTVSELKNQCQNKPKMSILASRDHLCIHSKVRRAKNKRDKCHRLLEFNGCKFARGNEKRSAQELSDILPEIWDIEDIVTAGLNSGFCPYYAAKTLKKEAEVVFAPYNYIIDPYIRKITAVGIDNNVLIIDEAHNIEEACMERASSEISEEDLSVALMFLSIHASGKRRSKKHLYETKDLKTFVKVVRDWMDEYKSQGFPLKELDKTYRLWTGHQIKEIFQNKGMSLSILENLKLCVSQLNERCPKKRAIILSHISFPIFPQNANSAPRQSQTHQPEDDVDKDANDERKKLSPKFPLDTISVLEKLITSFSMLFQETTDYRNEFKVLLSKSIQKDEYRFRPKFTENPESEAKEKDPIYSIHFWCLNAGVIFSEVGKLCRSVILTSGTLSPIVSYAKELGIHFEHTLEAPHVVPDENLWVGSISSGPDRSPLCGVFANFETDQYQDQLGLSILKLGKRIPNGVLVFFPSYSWIDKLMDRWTSTNLISHLQNVKHIFQEPKTKSKRVLEQLMCEYDEKASGFGAFMFAVYRGKMSEGIDFSDQRARGVICIGLPFPSIKNLRVKEKRVYNNAFYKPKSLLTGNEWYEMQAFRALNQALGRCIRHRNDWGAIILLDSRFSTNSRYIELLPMWIKNRVSEFEKFQTLEDSITLFIKNVKKKLKKQRIAMGDGVLKYEDSDVDVELLDDEDMFYYDCRGDRPKDESVAETESQSLTKTNDQSVTKSDNEQLTETEYSFSDTDFDLEMLDKYDLSQYALTKTDDQSVTKTNDQSVTKTDDEQLTETEYSFSDTNFDLEMLDKDDLSQYALTKTDNQSLSKTNDQSVTKTDDEQLTETEYSFSDTNFDLEMLDEDDLSQYALLGIGKYRAFNT